MFQIKHVDKARRTEKDDLDEEALVENLRPLIEKGTAILQETYGAIKAVDPDDKIAHAAQHRAKVSEATPEEQHLAQGLATLAGDVTKVIEDAKDLIKDMPHAQNQLGPLLEMFGEPLFQILGAVGMLLNGVLSLVVNIVSSYLTTSSITCDANIHIVGRLRPRWYHQGSYQWSGNWKAPQGCRSRKVVGPGIVAHLIQVLPIGTKWSYASRLFFL